MYLWGLKTFHDISINQSYSKLECRQLGIHHQVSSSSSSHVPSSLPLVESVNIIPNEKRPKLKSGGIHSRSGPIKDQFNGLKSTHFVGKMDSNSGRYCCDVEIVLL